MIPVSRSAWCALLLAAALAAGCGKHEPVPGAGAAPLDQSVVSSPASPSPNAGNIDATLSQLTSELRRYVLHTRSVPRNFEEFVAKSGVQAPSPPPGKKYAIQKRAVVLVKR
jgi:hypothetical protein